MSDVTVTVTREQIDAAKDEILSTHTELVDANEQSDYFIVTIPLEVEFEHISHGLTAIGVAMREIEAEYNDLSTDQKVYFLVNNVELNTEHQ